MRLLAVGFLMVLVCHLPFHAHAASFAAKDLIVLGRAIAFMQPPPSAEATIAIAFVAGNAASRQDAEAIAALIGGGLPAGSITMRPKVVEINSLQAIGSRVVVAAAGANGPRLSEVVRASQALCVTTDTEAVLAGFCAMAITSEPRVEILVNHTVSAAAGIRFAAAFRMMIREI